MSNPIRTRFLTPALALMPLVVGTPAFVSAADFRNQLDVDPQGTVEINGIGGKVEIVAWDQAKIEVSGSDDLADRIDIRTHGSRTVIEMRLHAGAGIGGDSTRMTVHVPTKSSVSGTWVSATVKVSGIGGATNLRTVSGDLSGEVSGDLKANTATGSVRIVARGAASIEVKTISGDVQLTAGSAEVELSTVSGNAKLELTTLTRGHMKSISGDLTGQFALAPDADFESQSVSGNIRLKFPSPPAAYYDIQSISGSIDSCFGPKVEKAEYGPGERLNFKTGDAKANVRIETKSGDVKICAA